MSEQATRTYPKKASRGISKRQRWTGERLEKRRQIDRDAQRAIRERTKNRIAEMQSTIDSLLQNQGDERVERLARQLRDQREENGRLKKLLQGIGRMIETVTSTSDLAMANSSMGAESESMSIGLSKAMVGANSDDSLIGLSCQVVDGSAMRQPLSFLDEQNIFPDHAVASTTLDTIQGEGDPSIGAIDLPSPRVGLISSNFTSPSNYLATSSSNGHSASSCSAKPIWEQVNNRLGKVQTLMTKTTSANTEKDADICLRAILHGWSLTEQQHDLDIGWRILRDIDQNIFSCCRLIDRLAIMRVMRLTLLRDMDPNREIESIPVFMAPRPTQRLIKHAKLIDYFVWPELRDHLILASQNYPPNQFSKLIPDNIRFLWPSALSALYTAESKTGLYSFSSAFDTKFQDLHCWTLCSDFFQDYPQLIGVIPIANSRPQGFSGTLEMQPSSVSYIRDADNILAEIETPQDSTNEDTWNIQDIPDIDWSVAFCDQQGT